MADVDELLDEMVAGKKPEEILGEEWVLRDLTRRLVERALEGEMTAHLGYEKHGTGSRSGNARNGKTAKRVKGVSGKSRSRCREIVMRASPRSWSGSTSGGSRGWTTK